MAREKSATVDLKIRMKEPLRAQIEAAAKVRGVSLNAEAVARLESSFARENSRYDDFGGRVGYEIFRVLGNAASALRKAVGTTNSWWQEPRIFDAIAKEICPTLLSVFRKEVAVSYKAGPGGTLYWRMQLQVANRTDDGGIGKYRTVWSRISRAEL